MRSCCTTVVLLLISEVCDNLLLWLTGTAWVWLSSLTLELLSCSALAQELQITVYCKRIKKAKRERKKATYA